MPAEATTTEEKVSLPPAPRLLAGRYELQDRLGAGGMGEVYAARDTTLQRDVAIKVLPAAFALDPDRMTRLQREALILASLNHPNIAIIHGLEESDGTLAPVLELIEGSTLAERISRSALMGENPMVRPRF